MYIQYLGAILIFGITPNFVPFLGATTIFSNFSELCPLLKGY